MILRPDNRFLHHMVRTIVGTAVDIGRGHRSPEAMTDILSAKDRKIAGINAIGSEEL